MQVYQIIICDDEGREYAGDLYWSEKKAIEVANELESVNNLAGCFSVKIQLKYIQD